MDFARQRNTNPGSTEAFGPSVRPRPQPAVNLSGGWYVLATLVIAVLYFAAARLGLSLASVHTNVSPVWPPTGIAIAAVLLLGYRVWPGILLGAFLANFGTPVPVATSVAIAIGNTFEALSAGFLLGSLGFHNSLDRARDVFKFVIAVLLCTMVSATLGTFSLCLGHAAKWADFAPLWMTWWLGDAVGGLVLAPLLLAWRTKPRLRLPKRRDVEAVALLLLLSLSAIATFGGPSPLSVHYYPLARLTVPLFLWAAFRLGQSGVTLASVVLSVFAVWGTANGLGPFISSTPNESLLLLQLFLGSNAVTFLFLVAVVQERRWIQETLRENERRVAAHLAVTRILAESPALSDATPQILHRIGETLGWEVGAMWAPDPEREELRCLTVWLAPSVKSERFESVCRERTFLPGIGLPGRVWTSLQPTWIPDVTRDKNFPRAPIATVEGFHGAFAFPILFAERFLGVMEFFSHEIREPDKALLAMVGSIGNQIGQFMERKGAEEALLENREWLRLTMAGSRMGTWTRELDGTDHVLWSPELERIFGLEPGEFPQTEAAFLDFVHPDDRPTLAEAVRRAIQTNSDYDIEFRYTRKDGARGWMLGRGRAFYDEAGKPYRLAGLGWDITERKQTEEALRLSEKELTEFFENATEAIHWVGPDGTILRANQAELRMLGYSADEYVGRNIAEFHVDKKVIEDILERLAQGETLEPYPSKMLGKDGSIRDVLINSSVYFEEGKFIHTRCFTRDVTEQLRVDKALRRMAAIVESTDDAVIAKDLNGVITNWNPGAEKLYGYTAREMIGKPIAILIPPDRPDEEPAILAKLRRGERIDHYETIRKAKDGTQINVSLTVSPIRNAAGKVIGASKIARDISEQKRAEQEREQLLARERVAREEAEIANRAKDEFLAVLSHELRTPLTAMLGWLAIMRGHRLDQKTTEHAIETIERNAQAQAQLIEDLVDVSRIVGGKLNLEVRPINLLPAIKAAIEVVRPAADAKSISIEINCDSSVGPVSGDPARLQQVIWNLLSNAVKFTPKGGTVQVNFQQVESSAEIIIRDTGVGISADFLPHVFERFRQAESAVTRSHRGMGLGLAIVRHLVELHGGTVTAASEGEDQGATFTIWLPLAASTQHTLATAVNFEKGEAANGMLNGIRILLVEDEPDARELIALTLRSSGADVEAVDSTGTALRRLQSFTPDVLLSDIGLPVQSGYDLIRAVRALPSNLNKVPAIALTAFATENDRQMSLSAGFHAHLAKPVEPDRLIETIKGLINGNS
jgi:PAS domain S-box-containing protein